jgi:serine/tyrosine/threonine adenylyltransferase
MEEFRFDNAFIRELPGDGAVGRERRQVAGTWSRIDPEPVAAPRLLGYSRELADDLGLDPDVIGRQRFAEVFAGNALLPGMQPWAANYGGHQFGHWAGQLGDGRAISLGELVTADGARHELQLKGAGTTPYSRGADGRAVLRSSLREFVCSEAMHHLGIPTTRALSLVGTGEQVVRDMFYDGHPEAEPGAVVCRVAPSFIRFGSFELPAARGDTALLERLVQFTVGRDFPGHDASDEAGRARWFAEVCRRTGVLMAHWMRVGFVHGVMNTDNMSILGMTIDYGPYGWLDEFDPDFTPNTTDAQHRRYRYAAQPEIAWWNLGRLAAALSRLYSSREPLEAGLQAYIDAFHDAQERMLAAKLGLDVEEREDVEDAATPMALSRELFTLMQAGGVDMTLAFRLLADVDPDGPDAGVLLDAFYDPQQFESAKVRWQDWLARLAARWRQQALPQPDRISMMRASNPRYVFRNYLAQQAIDALEQGDDGMLQVLMQVLRTPYEDHPGLEHLAARRPDWARGRAGCSMLSCSS